MERKLFAELMRTLWSIPGAHRRPPKCNYTHAQVLAVALWAALHDRPISWATQRCNWPLHDRVRALPSNATMSRRLRNQTIMVLLEALIGALHITGDGERTLIIDGRALTIARHSSDPDASFGRGTGGLGNGYKLHAIVDLCGNCRCFRVEPLKISEQAAAKHLITTLQPKQAGVLLADANYDSNELYELAGARGVQMLAQRRYANAKSIGHRRHSAHRLCALKLMRAQPEITQRRRFIESCFGTQGNVIGGLGPLPNHVRRLPRVRLWVALKLAIDAAHRRRRAREPAA